MNAARAGARGNPSPAEVASFDSAKSLTPGERRLRERDLSEQAGEHHERQRDHGRDHRGDDAEEVRAAGDQQRDEPATEIPPSSRCAMAESLAGSDLPSRQQHDDDRDQRDGRADPGAPRQIGSEAPTCPASPGG